MRGRNRGNGGGGGKGPNPLSRSYESNGPDVKIRGTASHIADKYVQLSRDALTSGDPVAAENYMQHAEHYYRMLAAAQAQFQPNAVIVRADDEREEYEDDGSETDNGDLAEGEADPAALPQPGMQAQPPARERPFEQPREFNREREQGQGREQGRDWNRGRGRNREREPQPLPQPSQPTEQSAAPDPAAQPQPVFVASAPVQPELPAFITAPVPVARTRAKPAPAPAPADAPAVPSTKGDEVPEARVADAGDDAAPRGRRRRYGRTARGEEGGEDAPTTDGAPVTAE